MIRINLLAAAADTYRHLAALQRRSKLKPCQCDVVLVSQVVREAFRRLACVIELSNSMLLECSLGMFALLLCHANGRIDFTWIPHGYRDRF